MPSVMSQSQAAHTHHVPIVRSYYLFNLSNLNELAQHCANDDSYHLVAADQEAARSIAIAIDGAQVASEAIIL